MNQTFNSQTVKSDTRTLIIGLRPEYVYPGRLEEWSVSNTLYAANFGANLICQSLIRQFNGTYVDDFSDIAHLRKNFDRCVLAFATHIHPGRDISIFADVVEKLDMPTFFLSGGISDYDSTTTGYTIHPSVRRLLEFVSSASEWIGVRGHYTAHVLHRAGFKNVVPIGCPTLFSNLDGPIAIAKQSTFQNPIIPYHLTLSRDIPGWIADKQLLAQDFQDQAVFTDELQADDVLQQWLRAQFENENSYNCMKEIVERNGHFEPTFDRWFSYIGQHDFVVGPRLHGCIAGLIQGIPTVMTPRDLRVREIAEFFAIPMTDYDTVKGLSFDQLYAAANYEEFNATHEVRLRSYLAFLRENKLQSQHTNGTEGELTFLKSDIDCVHRQWTDAAEKTEQANQATVTSDSVVRRLAKAIGVGS